MEHNNITHIKNCQALNKTNANTLVKWCFLLWRVEANSDRKCD